MASYYNEIDPFAAAWLRELIKAGLIAPGEVDERDIRDVRPDDLRGFVQCHFFAGIGVWSYALRNAGWSDDRPVWTGSCPCQPFSAAGKRGGTSDERHLWPHWHHLIQQCRPPIVFGEQVASKDGLGWLDLVHADLEGTGYAVGAADLCAAGVGAPHIRQRLWFVGEAVEHAALDGRLEWRAEPSGRGVASGCSTGELADATPEQHDGSWFGGSGRRAQHSDGGATGGLADTEHPVGRPISQHRENGRDGADDRRQEAHGLFGARSQIRELADTLGERGRSGQSRREDASHARQPSQVEHAGPTNGFWRAADWLYCRDDKWRPVEPGTFPLAHGAPARVGRLRGYGNAIVAEAARTFIEAYLDINTIDARHRQPVRLMSEMTFDIEGLFT